MSQAYAGEGELICEHCYRCSDDCKGRECRLKAHSDEQCIGGESDQPEHCAYCMRPLDGSFALTAEGVQCVLENVRQHLKDGIGRPSWRWEHGYYKGLGSDAVLLDQIELWVEPVSYRLNKRDRRTVELFVQWRKPREDAIMSEKILSERNAQP